MARLTGAVLAAAALAVPALATPAFGNGLERKSNVDSKVLEIKKRTVGGGSMGSKMKRATGDGVVSFQDYNEQEFVIELEVGGQTLTLMVGTSDTDTWIAEAGFQCLNAAGDIVDESDCLYGSTYSGAYEVIEDENFKLTYGDGEFLAGNWAYVNLTLGGITVPNQQVALVNSSYWVGDGKSSGLLGLGWPASGNAFTGTDPSVDSKLPGGNWIEYNPVIFNMISQGSIESWFSISLNRDTGVGYLGLGELPPVAYTDTWAATPIIIDDLTGDEDADTQITGYVFEADSYIFQGADDAEATVYSTKFPVELTTGAHVNVLPSDLTQAFWAKIDPAPVYNATSGAYFAQCDQTVPSLGIQINGTVFSLAAADLLMQDYFYNYQNATDGKDYCLLGVQDLADLGTGVSILGTPFMNNVVSVHDIGNKELRFAPYTY